MKKIIVMLVLLLVIISGCEILFGDAEINKIVNKGDPTMCKSLEGKTPEATQNRQDECYRRVAIEIGKPYACESIVDSYEIEKCYSGVAVKSGDSELCEKVSKKGDCYNDVAIESEDVNLCYKAENQKNNCLIKFAEKNGNSDHCYDMEPVIDYDRCFTVVAGKTGNWGMCGAISDDKSRMKCILESVKTSKNPKTCETYFKDNGDECWTIVAEDDSDYCLKVSEGKRENCYMKAAQAAKIADWCRDIQDESKKVDCVFSIARYNEKNPYVCGEVLDGTEAGDCYEKMARLRKDASYCEDIDKAGTRDKCIHNTAVYYKDYKVCEKLKDNGLKNECQASTKMSEMQE